MKLAVIKEKDPSETRVAITPCILKDFTELGFDVCVELDAGKAAGFQNDDYTKAGATICQDVKHILANADVVLTVKPPILADIGNMKEGAVLIGLLSALTETTLVAHYATRHLSAFSMELLPRITRAQSMDVLSSQSNLAGYKAAIEAIAEFEKVIPMMITAAGTIHPAKALVLGAGVAGLQAIATVKRIGAQVYAFDVRAAAKEQVESLGAKFIEVPQTEDAETSEGYAKEMSEEDKGRQAALIHETVRDCDLVICTALIPGKPAPVLITEAMVEDMRPGSVIVDLATVAGGNCALSEQGKMVMKNHIKIIGYDNMAGRLASDASRLYANNLFNFLELLVEKEHLRLKINLEDEIVKNTLVTHQGHTVHPSLVEDKIPCQSY